MEGVSCVRAHCSSRKNSEPSQCHMKTSKKLPFGEAMWRSENRGTWTDESRFCLAPLLEVGRTNAGIGSCGD